MILKHLDVRNLSTMPGEILLEIQFSLLPSLLKFMSQMARDAREFAINSYDFFVL